MWKTDSTAARELWKNMAVNSNKLWKTYKIAIYKYPGKWTLWLMEYPIVEKHDPNALPAVEKIRRKISQTMEKIG